MFALQKKKENELFKHKHWLKADFTDTHNLWETSTNNSQESHMYRSREKNSKFMEMIELFYFIISRNFYDSLTHKSLTSKRNRKHSTRSVIIVLCKSLKMTSFHAILNEFFSHFSQLKKSSRFSRSAEGGLRGVDNNDSSRRLVPNLSPMHPMSTKKKAPSS